MGCQLGFKMLKGWMEVTQKKNQIAIYWKQHFNWKTEKLRTIKTTIFQLVLRFLSGFVCMRWKTFINYHKECNEPTVLFLLYFAAELILCLFFNFVQFTDSMDLEDDTTVLTTLKSFNSFISCTEPPQRLSEHSVGTGNLQTQYKRSMEVNRDRQHYTMHLWGLYQNVTFALSDLSLCVVVGSSREGSLSESLPSVRPGEEADGAESQASSIWAGEGCFWQRERPRGMGLKHLHNPMTWSMWIFYYERLKSNLVDFIPYT